ncbi:SMC-Scp complex subunit ScpB [Bifidobacterium psychraerophilum]|jgi:segregation and condensation protein B|uniref:Transcriptional regulator n=1 Tax=Bifidobacterium psychraerophilum TaxID=218140 RepID=A0A087CDX0_9BIFI|nr:SMC-Scp complex subunit ScpB [Bifidobacterium psychraerophilum]KFI81470.1 transcriptional regulator [Bifidobacterium psychraerophilum]PKA95814.1 condensin subunit ScpB [Bifidobacterium psychraerophilum DSM 22366]
MEGTEYQGDDFEETTGTEVASQQNSRPVDTRPEYVDFDVNDFPGGLPACLEAMLMAADQPQHSADLARVLSTAQDQVEEALADLQDDYEGDASKPMRGFELRHTARGWQYCSRAVYENVVSAFVTDGQSAKLSQAALEALSIIAYKQPITRAQVAAIRGVNSDGVIRSLSIRGLVQEDGADPDTRAGLLATTPDFLDHMGLESIADLPSLAPFLPQVDAVIDEEEHR